MQLFFNQNNVPMEATSHLDLLINTINTYWSR